MKNNNGKTRQNLTCGDRAMPDLPPCRDLKPPSVLPHHEPTVEENVTRRENEVDWWRHLFQQMRRSVMLFVLLMNWNEKSEWRITQMEKEAEEAMYDYQERLKMKQRKKEKNLNKTRQKRKMWQRKSTMNQRKSENVEEDE